MNKAKQFMGLLASLALAIFGSVVAIGTATHAPFLLA
jgi:hypothetical protein